jgi:ABC-2 type transport system ATP-binding protein
VPQTHAVTAVDRLSFSIAPGERVAFIGPNGAGKSTTLKMLAGILRPDAGEARVLGLAPSRQRRELAYRIGTVFGQRSQLWYQLPARDTFELLGHVYGIEQGAKRRRIDALTAVFELGAFIDTPVRQLSLGQRMRCEIAASLLHAPRMLFLDEPTIGLDVSAKAVIRELLRAESDRDGVTLLLTSHDTGDMERVCDRVIVIHRGRLLWDGRIADLRRSYLTARRVTLWSDVERLDLALPGVRVISAGSYRLELEVALDITSLGQVVDAALRQGAVRDLAVEDAPLDAVIRALYADAEGRSAPS